MTFANDDEFEGIEVETPVGSFRAGRGGGWERSPEDPEYARALRRVRRVMGFYKHVATYVSVLILLLVVDLVTGPDEFWVQWVALIWGLVVLLHFLNVFVFDAVLGRDAERRMVEQELRKRHSGGQ